MLSFFLLMLLSFLLIFGIDNLLIPLLTEGVSYEEFSKPENYKLPEYIQAHRIVQLITQLFIFVLPAFIFAYLAYPKPMQYLKIRTSLNTRHVLMGILVMVLSIPFINLLEYFNKLIPMTDEMKALDETAQIVTDAFLTTNSAGAILFNIIIFVFVAAIGEELFFRGVFQNILLGSRTFRKYPFVAIAIAAFIFSLFHGQMSGLIPRFYAGFLLGCAYYFSNNIIVPIFMHALNNGFVLLMFYVSTANYDNPIGTLDYKDLLEIVPLTIISLFLLYRFYQRRNNYTIDKVEIDPNETHFLANR